MTASGVIYAAAGCPGTPGAHDGICRACGERGRGDLFLSWVRDTFTDWDKLTAGEIVCDACQFCFTDQNEALQRLLGRDKPQRMRNYSHFVVGGQWIACSKGDKATMRDLLTRGPDVAIVATSGQKHIIFRAQPGWWQIEEASARPFPAELAFALAVVERLYNAGISKAEIESGRYSQPRILQAGLDAWVETEAVIRPLRGTLRLQLALFLAQREEGDDGECSDAAGCSEQSAVALVDGHGPGVQEQVRAHDMAAVRGQRQERGGQQRDTEQIPRQGLFAFGE